MPSFFSERSVEVNRLSGFFIKKSKIHFICFLSYYVYQLSKNFNFRCVSKLFYLSQRMNLITNINFNFILCTKHATVFFKCNILFVTFMDNLYNLLCIAQILFKWFKKLFKIFYFYFAIFLSSEINYYQDDIIN